MEGSVIGSKRLTPTTVVKMVSKYLLLLLYTRWPRYNLTLISIASVFCEADLKSVIIDQAFRFDYIWATLYISV